METNESAALAEPLESVETIEHIKQEERNVSQPGAYRLSCTNGAEQDRQNHTDEY